MSEAVNEMTLSNLRQVGNKLEVQLKTEIGGNICVGEPYCQKSPPLTPWGLVEIQIRNNLLFKDLGRSVYKKFQTISVKMSKIFKLDSFIYKVTLDSTNPNIEGKSFFILDNNVNNASWQIFYESAGDLRINEFHLAFILNIQSCIFKGFPTLLEDTDMTDFELRGVDGSVKVHKAILASYSDVMKTMLSGEWKETSAGAVLVPNTTKETLQQLKDYMYVQKLPDNGIAELAKLASYYMMSELEEYCTVKLLTTLTIENVDEILDFAIQYKMKRLKLAILGNIRKDLINLDDMIKNCEKSE